MGLLCPLLAEIRTVSGSVEAACGLGLADAVVDLVETGTTMRVRVMYVFNPHIYNCLDH